MSEIDVFKKLLTQIYHESKNFSFIQIGANDGVKFDDIYQFVTSHKCRGVVVEPIGYYFEKLEENYSDYPSIIPRQCAVHHADKKKSLYYVDPAKLSSLPEWVEGIGSFDANHHTIDGVPSEFMIAEDVDCVHLMEIIENSGFDHINLLQLDTEGYDAEVIKMINFECIKPELIKFEIKHLSKKEKREIAKLLKLQGYRLFDLGHNGIAILHAQNRVSR